MKNYMDNTGLGTLWGLIKAKFATAAHTHKAADITDLTQIGKAGTGDGAEIFNDYEGNVASGQYAHAEGGKTTALEDYSHIEGRSSSTCPDTITIFTSIDDIVTAWNNAKFSLASGVGAHVEGRDCLALGSASHAEGLENMAYGGHAEGSGTYAYGVRSHTEGSKTTTFGEYSHAEGSSETLAATIVNKSTAAADIISAWKTKRFSLAKGSNSHVEGTDNLALGNNSHAEGNYTVSSARATHTEGYYTTASTDFSHAEGYKTTASGMGAHAEGASTGASANYAHAEGDQTTASGTAAHAEGIGTTAAGDSQHVQGHYNKTADGSRTGTSGTAFVVGNGTGTTASLLSNAFRIDFNGSVYATNATISTGADYAEYFEWADGNPDNEDRVGYFVTFDENKPKMLRIATATDAYILGIISGMPSVIGNGDEDWQQRYVTDAFGRYVSESFTYTDEQGTEHTGTRWKQNPAYDATQVYVSRAERKEWSAVGMLGVLSVRDDGTCQPGAYCTVADGGIATTAATGYRVLRRISETVVEVLFR